MILDVGERLFEPATTEAAVLCSRGLCYGAMGRDQTGCDRDSEAVCIEAAGWIVGFHLGLQRPGLQPDRNGVAGQGRRLFRHRRRSGAASCSLRRSGMILVDSSFPYKPL